MTNFVPERERRMARTNLFSETALENTAFLLVTEGTLLAPISLLCLVTNQIWPLYMMVIMQILGVVFGAARFNTPKPAPISFNPPAKALPASEQQASVDLKKAA